MTEYMSRTRFFTVIDPCVCYDTIHYKGREFCLDDNMTEIQADSRAEEGDDDYTDEDSKAEDYQVVSAFFLKEIPIDLAEKVIQLVKQGQITFSDSEQMSCEEFLSQINQGKPFDTVCFAMHSGENDSDPPSFRSIPYKFIDLDAELARYIKDREAKNRNRAMALFNVLGEACQGFSVCRNNATIALEMAKNGEVTFSMENN